LGVAKGDTKKMAKWILMNEGNCNDQARENEYHDWYRNTHIPDVLETPGFVKATRYELTTPSDGDKGKYALIYEIEADDLDSVMKKHQANMQSKLQQGRITNLLERKSRGIYQQVYCLQGKPSNSHEK
jgi:hypothetical protein